MLWLVLALAGCAVPIDAAESELVSGGAGFAPSRVFVGTYRPSTALWTLRMTRPGFVGPSVPDLVFAFGPPNASPVVGDWNGDGVETHGAVKDGVWQLGDTLGSSSAGAVFSYGRRNDAPIAGDWNGDGISTPGVFRDGVFYLRNENTSGHADVVVELGARGDVPLAGDFDGDGLDNVGVFRPSSFTFFLANAAGTIVTPFGNPTDAPIVGDWNGDGVVTLGVMRDGEWFLRNDHRSEIHELQLSFGSDRPIAGTWSVPPPPSSSVPASLTDFFPLAVDYQYATSFATWKSRGINTVIRVPVVPVAENIDVWTAAANAQGLRMIRDARPNPADDADEANLLAWIIADEPETHGQLEEVEARYAYLSTFGQRPIFVNFAGQAVLSLLDGFCNGPGDGPSAAVMTCYERFLRSDDWITQDLYPVNDATNIDEVGHVLDKLARWATGRPLFAYIEASNHGAGMNTTRPPSAAEFRAEVWLAIIHGARGIFYFPLSGCAGGPCTIFDAMTDDLVAEMTSQNARITSLAPVLQSAIEPPSIGFRSGLPLEATWRIHGGRQYYVVLNLSNAPVTRTMTVSGFVPAHPLTVVGEARTVGSAGATSFADSFGPYEVHVYRH